MTTLIRTDSMKQECKPALLAETQHLGSPFLCDGEREPVPRFTDYK